MNSLVETQIHAPCLFDGKPSAPHGEHHFRPDNPGSGKGMGGAHPHLDRLVCCRGCHDQLHGRMIIVDELDARIVRFHTRDGRKGERDLTVTDEMLAEDWYTATEQGRMAIVRQARVAYAFSQRYRWLDIEKQDPESAWYKRVADIIRQTGISVSNAVIYDRAAQGIAIAGMEDDQALDFLDRYGGTLASTYGKLGPSEALLAEIDQRLDNGEKRTAIAKALRSDSERAPKCAADDQPCVCKWCGSEYE